MSSSKTLAEIVDIIREFVAEREWKKYHHPVALALSASIEMGELLELFQWRTNEEIQELLLEDEYSDSLADEIADVLIYLINLADVCGIDPSKAIIDKMSKNRKKYPPPEWKERAPSKG